MDRFRVEVFDTIQTGGLSTMVSEGVAVTIDGEEMVKTPWAIIPAKGWHESKAAALQAAADRIDVLRARLAAQSESLRQQAIQAVILVLALFVASASVADVPQTWTVSSAQADAQQMAAAGVLRHCGRSGGRREGIGMGRTPEAARRACCFFGQYRIAEEGLAWSPTRRMWFAVIRYW